MHGPPCRYLLEHCAPLQLASLGVFPTLFIARGLLAIFPGHISPREALLKAFQLLSWLPSPVPTSIDTASDYRKDGEIGKKSWPSFARGCSHVTAFQCPSIHRTLHYSRACLLINLLQHWWREAPPGSFFSFSVPRYLNIKKATQRPNYLIQSCQETEPLVKTVMYSEPW